MTVCVNLSRAETGNGALDWFDVPVSDLAEWAAVINDIEKTRKRRGKR